MKKIFIGLMLIGATANTYASYCPQYIECKGTHVNSCSIEAGWISDSLNVKPGTYLLNLVGDTTPIMKQQGYVWCLYKGENDDLMQVDQRHRTLEADVDHSSSWYLSDTGNEYHCGNDVSYGFISTTQCPLKDKQ